MILELAFVVLSYVMAFLAQFMPSGDIPLRLPWGMDDMFVAGISGYKVLSTAFPPFTVVLNAFLIYIGFKIVMQLLKAIPILGRTIR